MYYMTELRQPTKVLQMVSSLIAVRQTREICTMLCIDCLLDAGEWMDTNYLKLNNEKTEVVLFVLRQQLSNVTPYVLNVCVDFAKDLGGTLGFPEDDD